MLFNIITCVDKNNGIGLNNQIPWRYTKDIIFFKKITNETVNNKLNVVLMGNNTYNSIPIVHRPLKNRLNLVLSKSNLSYLPNLHNLDIINEINEPIYFNKIEDLFLFLDKYKKYINIVWVIGGYQIYKLLLKYQLVSKIYLTSIENKSFNCDVKFPNNYLKHFTLIDKYYIYDQNKLKNNNENYVFINPLLFYHKTDKLSFSTYEYNNKEENNYIRIINKILNKGIYKIDRTNIGTLSLFGITCKYNIRNYRLPLFTHRKIFLRGIIEELLFFISGETNTKILENKGINIWKHNTSRDFLNSRQLFHLNEGDIGAGYSFQLRHFNAEYINCNTDYTNKGFDQLEYIINLIKTNPNSRRIVFSYWNPSFLDNMTLPPCHILYIFNIINNELNCSFTMRGNDFSLAHCFNVCSCAILVFMLCYLTGYNPGKIVCHIADCHIYKNHIEETIQFIKNTPLNSPLLLINDPDKKIKKIEDFNYNHFKLLFYNSYRNYKLSIN
jgi:dihydrofolate reductase / thymidylate synthase